MATALQRRQFFNEPEDGNILHGRVKRIMYKKYLQAFIPITQKFYNTVIIDGFAGTGRYGTEWPDAMDKYGSPLIVLMVSLNYYFKKNKGDDIEWGDVLDILQNKSTVERIKRRITRSCFEGYKQEENKSIAEDPNKIDLLFVEKNRNNFHALKDNVVSVLSAFLYFLRKRGCVYVNEAESVFECQILLREFPLSCKIFNRSFQEFDPPEIGFRTRCLTFADPFGYTHTPMNHVLKFCGPYSELLINLMSSYVNRFVSKNPKGVADLYGIREPVAAEFGIEPRDMDDEDQLADFVSSVIRGEDAVGNVQSCVKCYEKLLSKKSGATHSLVFEMRGKGNQIIYHLIFMPHHISGLKAMKESMNRCDQSDGDFRMSDYDVVRLGKRVTLGNDQDVTQIADAIFNEFHSRKVPITDIEDYILLETPYVYRKKPLNIMVKDGRIANVVDPWGNLPARRGTFPDHSLWIITFNTEDS